MASNCGLCGVCDNRQITKPSEVWCSECDEGLCTDCQEHHSVSKVTKHHATVSMVEYKKLPMEILQVCKKHNEKYEFFCRKHDCPCCKKCLKSHKDYKCLTGINEAIKNVKASNAFYEIEQSLLELVENIKQISTNRDDNLSSLETKKKEIKVDIKQTRTKINHHLDKLQEDLMKELMAMEQKESNKIRQLLTTLRQKEQEIAKYQANFAYIKHYASELQTFLSMKHIQKDMAVEETFIQSLTKSDTLNQVNISYQINKSLQQITANVQRFGDINVRSDPCDFSIQKRKDRQAQIMVAFPNRNIDNLTLTLQKRIRSVKCPRLFYAS
ncbi:RING finger protein 207-like [Mytilus californianus]|uniref:RING finger protein 207-like n=1 Tax=Mytilus californianus TaxID=6549 RepID=UPI0022459D9E|nr:RING finger protein 207-like [Mytilus californianus]